jgi:Ca2+-binding RTX toxin-like protein
MQLGYGYGGEADGGTYFMVDDVMASAFSDFVSGNNGANVLSGLGGNDTLLGQGGNDTLNGASGVDTLKGGDGNDTLRGGADKDYLSGGTGADHFVYNANADSSFGATNRDVVKDFSHAEGDKIDLSAIDANANASGDQAFAFHSGAFTAAGQVHMSYANGNSYVEANTSGNGGVDIQIELTGNHVLTASDFIL